MAAEYSSAAVTMGRLAPERARHAEADDLVRRNVAAFVDTPEASIGGRQGPSPWSRLSRGHYRSPDYTAIELRPGLKDIADQPALMSTSSRAEPAGRGPHQGSGRSSDHVDLDGDLDADPPVPPHVAVWRSVRVHGRTKTERSRRTLGLPRMSRRFSASLRSWTARPMNNCSPVQLQDTGLVFTTHLGAALDAGNVRKMSSGYARRRDRR